MKYSKLIIFTLSLVTLGLLGFSGYVFNQKSELNKKHEQLTSEFKGLEGLYKATGDEIKKLGDTNNADKVSKKYESFTLLGKCGVGIAIPDETNRFDPYSAEGIIDGVNRAWRLHIEPIVKAYSGDTNLLIGGTRNYVLLRNDNEASGYVSGYLSVECKENTEGYTTETFTTKYLDIVKKENKSMEAVTGLKASSLEVKKVGTVNKFGVEVNNVKITRSSVAESFTEDGYMFVYGNKVYYIFSRSMATEKKTLKSLTSMIDSIYLYK